MNICVFGASSNDLDQAFYTAAQALGLPDTLEGRGRWAELTGEA